tara:strand:+ start:1241 stop:3700 length:2460 start_codon:yes stop_codon:yes gene_type:complete
MQVILEALYALTDNYVLSIIFLSISINILLIPFQYIAEFWEIQHKNKLEHLRPKINLLKEEFKGQERHLYLRTLYRIYNYRTIDSLKASFGLLLQIPFFFAAFYFLENYDSFNGISFSAINDLGEPDGLIFGINFLPILMTIISLFSTYIYTSNKASSEKIPLFALSAFFLFFLYFESSALLIYWTVNNIFSLAKNLIEKKAQTNIIKQKLLQLLFNIAKFFNQSKQIKFIINDIFCQAAILFFGIIFLYKAIPIAASDTGMYAASYKLVVLNLTLFFLSTVTFAVILYRFLGAKWQDISMKLISFGAFSGLFFSFIMPIELEKISALAFPLFNINEAIFIKILKLLTLIPLLALWLIIFHKIKKYIWIILLFSNCLLLGLTLTKALNPKIFDVVPIKNSGELSINQAKKLYAFSEESNTLLIMLDTFQGNLITNLIDKNPKIIHQLSGFTYFPNTLSHGAGTKISMPALIGGYDFQMQFLLRTDENESYESTNIVFGPMEKAYLKNMSMAQKYNHTYALYNPSYVNCNIFNSYNKSICSRNVHIKKEALSEINYIYNPSSSFHTAIFFAKLSFILNMPHQTKTYLGRVFGGDYFLEYMNNVNQYAQLQNLTEFANLSSSSKTFKIFENKITHSLWMLNKECKLVNQNFNSYDGLFNSASCSLSLLNNFFNKLKLLGIYDKTKIIITSDHGGSQVDFGIYDNSFEDFSGNNGNYNTQANSASALMLVKDFNQSGDLKVSMQFLSNIDAYGIALSGVSEGKDLQFDRIKTPIKNRSLIYIHTSSPSDLYNITEAYSVTNNMFDKNNWKRLDQSQIKQLSQ